VPTLLSNPAGAPLPPKGAPGSSAPHPGGADELFAAVRKVIDADIRPFLQADGGDIELVEIVGRCVRVRMTGACETCPSSDSTLREGVEARIKARIGADYTIEELKR